MLKQSKPKGDAAKKFSHYLTQETKNIKDIASGCLTTENADSKYSERKLENGKAGANDETLTNGAEKAIIENSDKKLNMEDIITPRLDNHLNLNSREYIVRSEQKKSDIVVIQGPSQVENNDKKGKESEKAKLMSEALKRFASAERKNEYGLVSPDKPNLKDSKLNQKSGKKKNASGAGVVDANVASNLNIMKAEYLTHQNGDKNYKPTVQVNTERLSSPNRSSITAQKMIVASRSPGNQSFRSRNSSIKRDSAIAIKDNLNEVIPEKNTKKSIQTPKTAGITKLGLANINPGTKVAENKSAVKLKTFEPVLKKSARSSVNIHKGSIPNDLDHSKEESIRNDLYPFSIEKESVSNLMSPGRISERDRTEYQSDIQAIGLINGAKNPDERHHPSLIGEGNTKGNNKVVEDSNDDAEMNSDSDIDKRTKEILRGQHPAMVAKKAEIVQEIQKEIPKIEEVPKVQESLNECDDIKAIEEPKEEKVIELNENHDDNKVEDNDNNLEVVVEEGKFDQNNEIFEMEEEPKQLLMGKCDPIPNPNLENLQEPIAVSQPQVKKTTTVTLSGNDMKENNATSKGKMPKSKSNVANKSNALINILNSQMSSPISQMRAYKTPKQYPRLHESSPNKFFKSPEMNNSRQSNSRAKKNVQDSMNNSTSPNRSMNKRAISKEKTSARDYKDIKSNTLKPERNESLRVLDTSVNKATPDPRGSCSEEENNKSRSRTSTGRKNKMAVSAPFTDYRKNNAVPINSKSMFIGPKSPEQTEIIKTLEEISSKISILSFMAIKSLTKPHPAIIAACEAFITLFSGFHEIYETVILATGKHITWPTIKTVFNMPLRLINWMGNIHLLCDEQTIPTENIEKVRELLVQYDLRFSNSTSEEIGSSFEHALLFINFLKHVVKYWDLRQGKLENEKTPDDLPNQDISLPIDQSINNNPNNLLNKDDIIEEEPKQLNSHPNQEGRDKTPVNFDDKVMDLKQNLQPVNFTDIIEYPLKKNEMKSIDDESANVSNNIDEVKSKAKLQDNQSKSKSKGNVLKTADTVRKQSLSSLLGQSPPLNSKYQDKQRKSAKSPQGLDGSNSSLMKDYSGPNNTNSQISYSKLKISDNSNQKINAENADEGGYQVGYEDHEKNLKEIREYKQKISKMLINHERRNKSIWRAIEKAEQEYERDFKTNEQKRLEKYENQKQKNEKTLNNDLMQFKLESFKVKKTLKKNEDKEYLEDVVAYTKNVVKIKEELEEEIKKKKKMELKNNYEKYVVDKEYKKLVDNAEKTKEKEELFTRKREDINWKRVQTQKEKEKWERAYQTVTKLLAENNAD